MKCLRDKYRRRQFSELLPFFGQGVGFIIKGAEKYLSAESYCRELSRMAGGERRAKEAAADCAGNYIRS